MSKRKRASKSSTGAGQPAGDESATSAADDSTKEDMAHVSRDLLAGSPDIFAPKWTEEPAPAAASEVVPEPAAAESASEPVESAQPPDEAESAPVLAPPAPPPAPHHVAATVTPARPRGGGASEVLGIVLVV